MLKVDLKLLCMYSLPTSHNEPLVCTSEVLWTLHFTQIGPFKGKRNQY